MNDRLKIRVWDKVEKRYWTEEEVYLNIQWLLYPNNDNINNVIIEQCTGLKDKNGKLIHEGDLVKQENNVYKVVFSYDEVASCGCCVDRFSGCGFVMENKLKHRGDLDKYAELEVTGNINENKDLLK